MVLGCVRKVMSKTPHCTIQRVNRGVTFCEFVEARHDAVVFFQPAKHTLDDVALPILGSIKKPRQPRFWFALMLRRGITGSVCVGDRPSWVCTPNRAKSGRKRYRWPVRPIIETSGDAVGIAEHVNLGGHVTPAAPERVVLRFLSPVLMTEEDEAFINTVRERLASPQQVKVTLHDLEFEQCALNPTASPLRHSAPPAPAEQSPPLPETAAALAPDPG